MNYQSTAYASHDGFKLSGYVWIPEGSPKAVINLVHGFQEYCERYDDWAMRFTKEGYVVMGIDLRGHGKSDGRRGHINKFDDFLNDVEVLLKESMKLYPNIPHLLYGQSLGGNIVTHYAAMREHNLSGLIVTSPWYKLAYKPSSVKTFLAKIMSIVHPKFTQKSNLDLTGLSQDDSILENVEGDSLAHEKISAKLFTEVTNAAKNALNLVEKLNMPVLFMHGTGDRITSFEATKDLFDKAQQMGKDVEYREWRGLYHELHNELNKDEVFEYIVSWLGKKL